MEHDDNVKIHFARSTKDLKLFFTSCVVCMSLSHRMDSNFTEWKCGKWKHDPTKIHGEWLSLLGLPFYNWLCSLYDSVIITKVIGDKNLLLGEEVTVKIHIHFK